MPGIKCAKRIGRNPSSVVMRNITYRAVKRQRSESRKTEDRSSSKMLVIGLEETLMLRLHQIISNLPLPREVSLSTDLLSYLY